MTPAEGCALVTGASRGIGAATARRLAADGWPVAIGFRSDEEGASATAEAIEQAGGTAVTVRGDVSDPAEAERVMGEAEGALGRVAVLVNNAGTRADGLVPQMSDDDWDRVLDTNLGAAFRLMRRALGPMIRARFGRIVNVASIVGPKGNPGQANYAASKAGLIALTRTAAAEVARRGITINAVAPGFVETELTSDVDARIAQAIPARRAGRAEEIAACIGFLASDEASYVTGAVLTVDGGMTA